MSTDTTPPRCPACGRRMVKVAPRPPDEADAGSARGAQVPGWACPYCEGEGASDRDPDRRVLPEEMPRGAEVDPDDPTQQSREALDRKRDVPPGQDEPPPGSRQSTGRRD